MSQLHGIRRLDSSGVEAILLRRQNGNQRREYAYCTTIDTHLPTDGNLTGDLLVVLGIFLHCDQEDRELDWFTRSGAVMALVGAVATFRLTAS